MGRLKAPGIPPSPYSERLLKKKTTLFPAHKVHFFWYILVWNCIWSFPDLSGKDGCAWEESAAVKVILEMETDGWGSWRQDQGEATPGSALIMDYFVFLRKYKKPVQGTKQNLESCSVARHWLPGAFCWEQKRDPPTGSSISEDALRSCLQLQVPKIQVL